MEVVSGTITTSILKPLMEETHCILPLEYAIKINLHQIHKTKIVTMLASLMIGHEDVIIKV